MDKKNGNLNIYKSITTKTPSAEEDHVRRSKAPNQLNGPGEIFVNSCFRFQEGSFSPNIYASMDVKLCEVLKVFSKNEKLNICKFMTNGKTLSAEEDHVIRLKAPEQLQVFP